MDGHLDPIALVSAIWYLQACVDVIDGRVLGTEEHPDKRMTAVIHYLTEMPLHTTLPDDCSQMSLLDSYD